MQLWIGIGFAALGIFEFLLTVWAFRRTKRTADKNTSHFMPAAFYASITFGLIFVAVGIAAALGQFGRP